MTGETWPCNWRGRYAHHGRIWCDAFGDTHSQVWGVECDCGWYYDLTYGWAMALALLQIHQRLSDPRWAMFVHRPMTAPDAARTMRDAIDRTPLQQTHRPNGARS